MLIGEALFLDASGSRMFLWIQATKLQVHQVSFFDGTWRVGVEQVCAASRPAVPATMTERWGGFTLPVQVLPSATRRGPNNPARSSVF